MVTSIEVLPLYLQPVRIRTELVVFLLPIVINPLIVVRKKNINTMVLLISKKRDTNHESDKNHDNSSQNITSNDRSRK